MQTKFVFGALLAILLVAFLKPALAVEAIVLPVQPKPMDFKTLLPECKVPDVNPLPSLRRCRSDLEVFRESTLEAYNRKIKRYVETLRSQDVALQSRLAARSISLAEYQKLHEQIASGLSIAGPEGDLMDSYRDGLLRYQELAKWVIGEIESIELRSIQPA